MRKTALTFLLFFATATAHAQLTDPQKIIEKDGYHTKRIDGDTVFYTYKARAPTENISLIEKTIERAPKDDRVFRLCDFMRGGIKAKVVEKTKKSYDVAVTDYGYQGAIIACTLKHVQSNKVGTQIIFSKEANKAVYMVFVTD